MNQNKLHVVTVESEPGTDERELIWHGVGSLLYHEHNELRQGFPKNRIVEPDVAYIDTVDVNEDLQGQKYGRALLAAGLESARTGGFKLCNMHITNPAIVKIVDDMAKSGTIKEAAFMLGVANDDSEGVEIPSADVLNSPERFDYDTALAQAQACHDDYERALISNTELTVPGVRCVVAL